jgi:hypothetical protein
MGLPGRTFLCNLKTRASLRESKSTQVEMRRSTAIIFFAIPISLFVIALTPLSSLNCPSWDVWVTDQQGQPEPNLTVRLTYRDHSAEPDDHESDAITDAQGHTIFPSRILKVSLGSRALQILSSAREGAHASFGRHASVFAFGQGLEGFDDNSLTHNAVDWTGKSDHMISRIIVVPEKK